MNRNLYEMVAYLIINILYLYDIHLFLNKTLQGKQKRTYILFFSAYGAYYVAIHILLYKFNHPLTVMIINFLFIFGISMLYERKHILNNSMIALLLYCLGSISEVVVLCGFSFILRTDMTSLMGQKGLAVIMKFIANLLLFLFVRLIPPFLGKRRWMSSAKEYPPSYWLSVILIPISSIVGIYGIYRLSLSSTGDTNLYLLLTIVMLAVINCLVFHMYDRLMAAKKEELRNAALEMQIKYYYNQFELAYDAQLNADRLRHDIKNKLIGLKGYLPPLAAEAEFYLQCLLEEASTKDMPACCGIPVVDAVINSKAALARKSEIAFQVDILTEVKNFNIDPTSMSILLGNALDNAIEANLKLPPEKRNIQIKMAMNQMNLLLVIRNSFNGVLEMDAANQPMTSKKDRSKHGYGFMSIRKIVERLGGELSVNASDHEFSLSILLYANEAVQSPDAFQK